METSNILNSLGCLGIEALNAMQQDMVEAWGGQEDIVLLSPTGTGKTLAYLLPLTGDMDTTDDKVQAVVMTPSRELAMQTADVVRRMNSGVRVAALYGGRPAMDEHRMLNSVKPHIVACTPGRLCDHLAKGNIALGRRVVLVIDEFDKCLELGFRDEMRQAINMLPAISRRILLSATDAADLPSFAGKGHRRIDHLRQAGGRIRTYRIDSPEKDKIDTLRRLICHTGGEMTLVFVGYRESAERVARLLKERGVTAGVFHGAMEQRDRERALYMFANGSVPVMVSTDLAARGLDIAEVKHIVHYHLPQTEEIMTHRNGRTARWQAEGTVWLIVGPEETLPAFAADAKPFRLSEGGDVKPSPWVTIYIGKGKKDKISRGDIVGFLSKAGGLQRDELGRVDVGDHWAYAAVSRKKLKSLVSAIRGQKIKGLKTIIEPAKGQS